MGLVIKRNSKAKFKHGWFSNGFELGFKLMKTEMKKKYYVETTSDWSQKNV